MTVTYVAAVAGEALLIKVGDGAGPEVFTAPALINAQRDLKLSTTEKAVEIPRVDTPGAPAKTVREITAIDWQLTGAGVLNSGDDKVYADWLISGAAKNVKIINSVTGGLTLTGSAVLTDFQVTGNRGDKVQVQMTLKGADLPVSTATP